MLEKSLCVGMFRQKPPCSDWFTFLSPTAHGFVFHMLCFTEKLQSVVVVVYCETHVGLNCDTSSGDTGADAGFKVAQSDAWKNRQEDGLLIEQGQNTKCAADKLL